jgi:energy-coupling factor transporter ATP-binding protein EcfA2
MNLQQDGDPAIPGMEPFDLGSDDEKDQDIQNEALRVLQTGDPIRYILDTFALAHEGDEIVAQCLLMSLASRAVIKSKGLHVLVTGESGKGKSHAFESMMDLIPQEYCLGGRLTDKALFYQNNLRKGSVICLDDVSLSFSLQETLKGVTTSFKKPFIYRTLDKDRNSLTKVIPERCLWWIAKKEGTGDDQVWNRMLTVWIDDSQIQDDLVLARELDEAARPASPCVTISREMRICRALWDHLASVSVRIPFARRIRFTNSKNRRNSSMLLDLVRSIALLFQYQR